jgi:hypothetical protein
VVPITDLAIKRDDLVVATQGRSFWILDHLGPLRQWNDSLATQPFQLFQPDPALRSQQPTPDEAEDLPTNLGTNRPNAAFIDLWLKEVPKAPIVIEILSGPRVLRRFSSRKPDLSGDLKARQEAEEIAKLQLRDKPLELKPGLNRVPWDMRLLPPRLAPRVIFNEGDRRSPKVAPGIYTVRVTVGDQTATADLRVLANPDLKLNPADLQAQFELLAAIGERLSENQTALLRVRDLREQVKAWAARAALAGKPAALQPPALALIERLTVLEGRLTNPDIKADEDDLVYEPKLDHEWAWLSSVVASADARPTPSSKTYYEVVRAQQEAVLKDLAALEAGDLAAFQRTLDQAGLPRISPGAAFEAP